jgi:hypothetical protein
MRTDSEMKNNLISFLRKGIHSFMRVAQAMCISASVCPALKYGKKERDNTYYANRLFKISLKLIIIY